MKILIVANELKFTCGITSHLVQLVSGLKREDNLDVLMICGSGNRIQEFIEMGVEVKYVKYFNHQKRGSLFWILGIIYLGFYCVYHKIEVVHSHHYYSANMANIISKIFQIKTIQTNHGLLPEISKLDLFCADEIIAVNEHIVDYIISKKIKDSHHIHLIRCGIEFNLKSSFKNMGVISIITASRLVNQKGIDLYVKAVASIKNGLNRQAEFFIAGEGSEEKKLKELNEDMRAGIKFLGNVTDMDLRFGQTHIFVNPTRSVTEGFPVSMIEAGLNKNLILTSDFSGLKPVFDSEQDGFVFEIDNEKSLAEMLLNAIENYENYHDKMMSFHTKTIQLFSKKEMVEKTKRLYISTIQS